jgi:small subunit ribosomal protein S1
MSNDDIPEMNFVDMDADFASLMEKSVDSIGKELVSGDKITGRVSMIGENSVFVELNGKSEGIIPKVEFIDGDELKIQEGDEVTAYFVSNEGGEVSLTLRMSGDALLDSLGDAYANQVPVEGKVLEERKGGYTISLAGLTAFCPYSQIDARTQNPEFYIGKTLTFVITRLTERDVVVSRRPIVEEEAKAKKEELISTLNEGDELDGIVRKIESFGVFIDIGAMDGLVPMGEISWDRNFDVNDLVKVGDKVSVTVRKLDWERDRIVLSLRESEGNPWLDADDLEFNVAYKGIVTRLESYGAFVQLPNMIEGLMHISKFGEGRRLAHASEVLSVGEEVEVFVLDVDVDARRISLSREDADHDIETHEKSGVPTGHSNAVKVGNTVTGKVDGIKNFGAFIKLSETKSGLIHVSTLDLPPNGDALKFLTGKFPVGSEVEVEILHIENNRISLALPGTNAEAESRSSVKSFMQKNKSESFGSLGDLFGDISL